MGKFGNDDRFGKDRGGDRFGKRSFGGGRGGFGGSRGPSDRPQMHSAVCGECGEPCEVPFRPVSGRPVFCNNCFRKQKDAGAGAPSFGAKPAGDRFSRPRFDRPSAPTPVTVNLGQFKEQLELLNVKLDRILRALAPVESGASVAIVESRKTDPSESIGILSSKYKAKTPIKSKKVSAKKKK